MASISALDCTSPLIIFPKTGAPPVPLKTVFAAPTPIVEGAVPLPPPTITPLAVRNCEEEIVVGPLKKGIPPDTPDCIPVPPLVTASGLVKVRPSNEGEAVVLIEMDLTP